MYLQVVITDILLLTYNIQQLTSQDRILIIRSGVNDKHHLRNKVKVLDFFKF